MAKCDNDMKKRLAVSAGLRSDRGWCEQWMMMVMMVMMMLIMMMRARDLLLLCANVACADIIGKLKSPDS